MLSDRGYPDDLRRTRAGLILMIFAAMTLWIPYVQYAGYLLEIAGAAMLMRGRKGLGGEHARNVSAAFYLFILATAAQAAIVAYALLTSFGSVLRGHLAVPLLLLLDYGPVLLSIIAGLIFVLPVVRLETEGGQSLLWVAFGSGLLLGLLSTFGGGELAFSGVPGFFGHLTAALLDPGTLLTTVPPLYYLAWGMLTVIPYGLFAYGIFLALGRLDRFVLGSQGTVPMPETE